MDNNEFITEMTNFFPTMIRVHRRILVDLQSTNEQGLPPMQLNALMFLKRFGTMNMSQLAEHLAVSRQQLTKIVESLVEKELVERQVDDENRRNILIKISQKGTSLLKKMFFDKGGMMSRLGSELTDKEREKVVEGVKAFKEVLLIIEKNLE